MNIRPASSNVLTGVGKSAPVLEDQEVKRGPATVSVPVSQVGTPGAKIVEADRAQRVVRAQQDEIDRQSGIGATLDVTG